MGGLLNILRQGVFFLSYIKFLLSTNYVSDTVLGIEHIVVNKTKSLCPHGAYILMRKWLVQSEFSGSLTKAVINKRGCGLKADTGGGKERLEEGKPVTALQG